MFNKINVIMARLKFQCFFSETSKVSIPAFAGVANKKKALSGIILAKVEIQEAEDDWPDLV